MSLKGSCCDNAVAESFLGILNMELVNAADSATRDQDRCKLFEYMEVVYNRQRRYSLQGYVSPGEYEPAASLMAHAA